MRNLLPVCVTCSREMRFHRTGVTMVFYNYVDLPYYTIAGDCYRCPHCGAKIISGFSDRSYDDEDIQKALEVKGVIIVRDPLRMDEQPNSTMHTS
jgi:DNA-directed RNA polymerase subunit RPC12/RpoP